MHDVAPKLAAADAMVRFLAPFRRGFSAIAAYGAAGDRAGLLLGGFVANALHNVPGVLWHYDEAAWHAPTATSRWLEHDFLARLRAMAPPAPLLVAAEGIFATEGTADALGLPGGPSQVVLPPLDRLRACLELLYHACLEIRSLRNLSGRPKKGACLTPWVDFEGRWAARDDAHGAYCGEVARALGPLATAVVNWPAFDEGAFVREVLTRRELARGSWREQWARAVGAGVALSTNDFLTSNSSQ